ncbi:MAG: sensor histidine kinase [Clostridia bacterium]|nr:sensor histidine kinase [Clostridia bacterium]
MDFRIPLLVLAEYAILQFSAIMIFMRSYPLRNRPAVRILIGVCVIAVSIVSGMQLYNLALIHSSNPALNILLLSLVHFIIYICICFSVCLIWGGNILALLFNCVVGYAVKLLAENIFYLISMMSEAFRFEDALSFQSIPALLMYELFRFVVFAVCYAAVYFGFLKNLLPFQSNDKNVNSTAFAVSVATILVCHVLNLVRTRFTYQTELNIVAIIFSSFCCLLVILLKAGFLEQDSLKIKLDAMKELWVEREKQLTFFQENISILNMKYHDLKRSIMLLQAGGCEDDIHKLLNEVTEKINIYDEMTQSGDSILDTVLTQYRMYGDAQHIQFSYIVDGGSLSFISNTDLVALIGNMLENAVDAVKNLEEDTRFIRVKIAMAKGMPCIYMENPYAGTIVKVDGIPISAKLPAEYHGFGMKSIMAVVKKYNGIVSIDTDDNLFRINILFPS